MITLHVISGAYGRYTVQHMKSAIMYSYMNFKHKVWLPLYAFSFIWNSEQSSSDFVGWNVSGNTVENNIGVIL